MQTAMEFYGHLPSRTRRLAHEIRVWRDTLPDRKLSPDGAGLWYCHALTRAASRRWGLATWVVADGFFGTHRQHSWLMHPRTDEHPALILDVLPVAAFGGPLVLEAECHPYSMLYEPRTDFYSADHYAQWEEDARHILSLSGSKRRNRR